MTIELGNQNHGGLAVVGPLTDDLSARALDYGLTETYQAERLADIYGTDWRVRPAERLSAAIKPAIAIIDKAVQAIYGGLPKGLLPINQPGARFSDTQREEGKNNE